jgi:shikimate kinase
VREARQCGKAAADGMVMLIAQAYRAFRLSSGEVGLSGNLYLYGPPASGKSTWARRLADATGAPLVDIDAEIVREEGRSIADIFAVDGEASFRRIEKSVLSRIVASQGKVVALGGGALLDGESRRLVEATGRVVLIDCPTDELLRRAAASSDRPLLAGDKAAKLAALLAARRAHYDSFSSKISLPDFASIFC